jgi:nicotinate-nucleotide adenylyltransferase
LRVGVFGGSFNPIHDQHIRIAEAAKEQLNLDEIWFLPVFKAVHKNQKLLLSYSSRRTLLSAAISKHQFFDICDAERELEGNSYTIRTLRYLKQKFPKKEFHLIIGGDSLADLSSWREAEALVKLIPLAVIRRPGVPANCSLTGAKVNWIDAPLSDASSSSIREMISKKEFSNLPLSNEVLFEIFWGNFYNSLEKKEAVALEQVKNRFVSVPEGLRLHMKSVALQCIKLCRINMLSPVIGFFLGLGHDLFRASPENEILKYAKKSGFQFSPIEIELPMLLHGAASAAFFKEMGLFNDDFIKALRFHTFPDKDNGMFTMILSIADTLDPSRGKAERTEILASSLPLKDLYLKVLQIKKVAAGKV